MLAFLTDRRQRRIRGPQDVTRADVPVLMNLPARGPAPELTLAAARSPLGREFSELAHVLTGAMGFGRHVILVSGIIRGQAPAWSRPTSPPPCPATSPTSRWSAPTWRDQ